MLPVVLEMGDVPACLTEHHKKMQTIMIIMIKKEQLV
jgi:hypothetical protein